MAGEILINSATKAMSELSESLFVPAMIIGLIVEFPKFLIDQHGLDLLGIYLGYAFVGLALSFSIIIFLANFRNESQSQYFIAGSFLLPIGIATVMPEYFTEIEIPLHKVTGVCICVWSFYLIKIFFDHANKREESSKK